MFFPLFWRGSGGNPQITSAQDRGARWRSLVGQASKLHYFLNFEAPWGCLGALPSASGVSDRTYAASMHCMYSVDSTTRARRTSPTGPRRSALEACKKQCFSLYSGGFRAQPLKLPTRRTVASVGASWRPLVRHTRKLHYFMELLGGAWAGCLLLAAWQAEKKNCIYAWYVFDGLYLAREAHVPHRAPAIRLGGL